MLSDNEEFQASQLQFIEVFLDRFTKEMERIPFVGFDIKREKDVYYISWLRDFKPCNRGDNGEVYYTGVDYYKECMNNFIEYVDKYLAGYGAIGGKMEKERYTNCCQEKYRKYFFMYAAVSWRGDIKSFTRKAVNKYPRYGVNGSILKKDEGYEWWGGGEYGDPRVENAYPYGL